MKFITLLACLVLSVTVLAQNHSKKPIRFIFETIHDHLGNLDINSKRVQLFSRDHRLLYEADLYDGNELDEQFFYYNEKGDLLRDHRNFHQPHESGDLRMTYDAKGNLIEETDVDDEGHVLEKITMTYNDKGQMITEVKEFYHRSEGQMITESNFSFTYGADGKVASKKGWEDEKESRIVEYKYVHEAKKETKTKHNSSGTMVEKWVQEWDDKGRLIKDIHSMHPPGRTAVTKTVDFTYDQYDHILTEVMSKSNSSIKKKIIFEYTYDEYGNWIERKERKEMGAKKTNGNHLVRHIEYYEDREYAHPPMEMDESFQWEDHAGEAVKLFEESHVRINNNDGELEWVVRRNGQSLFQVDEYEYNKDGKLERINHLNHSKGDNAYTLTSYDDKGQMTSEIAYSWQGVEDEKMLFQYDAKGNLIRMEEQRKEGGHGPLKTEIVEEYEYTGGQLTKMTAVEFGSTYVTTYEYDSNGQMTKEVVTPKEKGEDVITTTFVYDNGKLMSKTEITGKSKVPSDEAKYKYDGRGELIQSAHYRDGKIHSEIDYVYFE